MSSVQDINDKFNSRMVNLGTSKSRPANPFASRSNHTTESLTIERNMTPEVTATSTLGTIYTGGNVFGSVEHVVDTKSEQYVNFSTRAITHPRENLRYKTTGKIPTDGTREK